MSPILNGISIIVISKVIISIVVESFTNALAYSCHKSTYKDEFALIKKKLKKKSFK